MSARPVFPILFACFLLPARSQPLPASFSARIAEEADALEQNALRIVTVEQLEQRSILPPTRFRPRAGSTAELATGPQFRVRAVRSEFSFGTLRNSQSHQLVEFRQVLSVDGESQQSVDNALRSLGETIREGDDRARKRLLEEFARNGLVDIATDYALILLAFTAPGQKQMDFTSAAPGYVGTDRTLSFGWKQRSAQGGVLEFRGADSVHRALQGTLWVRSDGLPLRVSAWMEYPDRIQRVIRDEATVDYILSEHGFLTPASVIHRHLIDGTVLTENLYTYEPFRLFSSSSTISFGSPK